MPPKPAAQKENAAADNSSVVAPKAPPKAPPKPKAAQAPAPAKQQANVFAENIKRLRERQNKGKVELHVKSKVAAAESKQTPVSITITQGIPEVKSDNFKYMYDKLQIKSDGTFICVTRKCLTVK